MAAIRYGLEQDAFGIPYLVAEGTVGDGMTVLGSSDEVKDFLASDGIHLACRAEEHVLMLTTDVRMHVRGVFELSHGTSTMALLSPKMVLSRALLMGSAAEGIILAHNHPSGDVTPSREDRKMADLIRNAGKLAGVELSDFVIVGGSDIYSFLEQGEFGA